MSDGNLTSPARAVPVSPAAFWQTFFDNLEIRGITYIVFDRNEPSAGADGDFPNRVFHTSDLPALYDVLVQVAANFGLLVAQSIQLEVGTESVTVVNPADLRQFFKLELCSDLMNRGRRLIPASVLLEGRHKINKAWRASASSGFAYALVHALTGTEDLRSRVPELRKLWQDDPANSALQLRKLLGKTFVGFEKLEKSADNAALLRQRMEKLHPSTIAIRLQQFGLALKQLLRPTGLHLAVMGPDGVGKSTLLEQMDILLKPCFRSKQRFHFRPHLFQPPSKASVSAPHAQSPRGIIASWSKLLYYFADNFAGYWFAVLPHLWKSGCVIFDRQFDDIIIDPRRYRLKKSKVLAFALRWLLPQPDITFVLDASSEVVHRRKPELPQDEIRRQRQALRHLAAIDSHYFMISAEDPAEQVAQAVCRQTAVFLAARLSERNP